MNFTNISDFIIDLSSCTNKLREISTRHQAVETAVALIRAYGEYVYKNVDTNTKIEVLKTLVPIQSKMEKTANLEQEGTLYSEVSTLIQKILKNRIIGSEFKNIEEIFLLGEKEKVKILDISNFDTIKHVDIVEIAKQYPNLTQLSVDGRNLDKESIHFIKKNFPGLVKISLINTTVEGGVLAELVELPRLEVLDLTGGNNVDEAFAKKFKDLQSLYKRNIHTLNISNCQNMRAESLSHFAFNKQLKTLHLSKSNWLTPNNFLILNMFTCSGVKHLDISECPNLDVTVFSVLKYMLSLHSIDLSNSAWLNYDVDEKITSLNATCIDLSGCIISKEQLANFLNSDRLVRLQMSKTNRLNNRMIKKVKSNSPNKNVRITIKNELIFD